MQYMLYQAGLPSLPVNYAHPLTPEQLTRVAELLGNAPEIRDLPVQIERDRPLAEVACELADAAALTQKQWQTLQLILNPPGLAPLALALIAEIHGRSGHFPAIVNIRPVSGSLLTQYEVQDIIDLQAARDAARAALTVSAPYVVVTVLDYFADPSGHFLVMEYIGSSHVARTVAAWQSA